MREIVYSPNTVFIDAVLIVLLIIAVAIGCRFRLHNQGIADEESRSRLNAFQATMLGVLAPFDIPWGIGEYTTGATGHRPSKVAALMLVLVVLLVFIIIDLDQPDGARLRSITPA